MSLFYKYICYTISRNYTDLYFHFKSPYFIFLLDTGIKKAASH